MIPFCRTVSEAHRVLDTMATDGLKKGENGLRVYAMCEIPSNVILAEQFLDVLDGFSIGSNDLTQVSEVGMVVVVLKVLITCYKDLMVLYCYACGRQNKRGIPLVSGV